jgi:hypothetical protein
MANITGVDGAVYIGSAKTITGATHAAGVVTVTSTAHGFSAGAMVLHASVVGMTDLNGHFVVQSVTTNTYTVTLTTAQTYTSGGTAQEVIECTRWEKSPQDTIVDTTDSSNSGWRQKQAKVLKKTNGTIAGYIYEGNDPQDLVGTSIALKLYRDTTNYWSGTAVIGNVAEVVPIEGEEFVQATYEWEGSGAWSLT